MDLLKLLGLKSKTKDIESFASDNAIVVDVRTPSEFSSGHVPQSINVPLETLKSQIPSIKNYNRPVITCCATGVRSAQASKMLKSEGIKTVNGGGWDDLMERLAYSA